MKSISSKMGLASPRKKILMSFTEGRVVRDLLNENILSKSLGKDFQIILATPAAAVPYVKEKWINEGYVVLPLVPYEPLVIERKAITLRKKTINNKVISLIWKVLEKINKQETCGWEKTIAEIKPDLVVITNPMLHSEMHVWRAAKQNSIPVLGILRSWDNLYKGLRIKPDHLAVWNNVNLEEAITLENFSKKKIHVIGSSQFDPYFDESQYGTREDLAKEYDLNPCNPIIVLATSSSVFYLYDETYLMDVLLMGIRDGFIDKNSQIICRLHPASKMEYFLKYKKLSNVRLSLIDGYIPTIGWTMSREDVVLVGRMLRYADVVVSPGSTITIETAIFDTPVIVPTFHSYQPDMGKKQTKRFLSRHYFRIKELGLVPFADTPEELYSAINIALSDHFWYRTQRLQIIRDYIQFTDGKSIDRLADLIVRLVDQRP